MAHPFGCIPGVHPGVPRSPAFLARTPRRCDGRCQGVLVLRKAVLFTLGGAHGRGTGSVLFDFVDFAAVVVTAVRANPVRLMSLAAIGADDQSRQRKRVVRAAAVPFSFRVFALRKRRHDFSFQEIACRIGRRQSL